MRILHHEGRIVAINKSGKWEPLNGVSRYEVAKAIQYGEVEDYITDTKPTQQDMIDFAIVMAGCVTILFMGMFLFGMQ